VVGEHFEQDETRPEELQADGDGRGDLHLPLRASPPLGRFPLVLVDGRVVRWLAHRTNVAARRV
jgi:hypothetical protein